MTPYVSARLASLAYGSDDELSAGLPPEIQNAHFITQGSTQLFIADAPNDEIVISFRGTEPDEIQDWIADLRFDLIAHVESGGKIHHGFASELAGVWPEVHAEIMRRDPDAVRCIGHSLGGALATLCAAKLADLSFPDLALVTFGCPRVGTRRFTRWLRERLTLSARHVNSADVVPRVPAIGFRLNGWKPEWCGLYRQLGPAQYYDVNGRGYSDPPKLFVAANRLRAYWRDLGKPGLIGIKDHSMDRYLEVVR